MISKMIVTRATKLPWGLPDGVNILILDINIVQTITKINAKFL